MPLKEPKNIEKTKTDIVITDFAKGGELIDPKDVGGRVSCSKIHVPPHKGFARHIHPSDHILIILDGSGWMTYSEKGKSLRLNFQKGDVFPVPSNLEHAVTAGKNGVTLLAIGSPARLLNDPERMKFV